MTRIVLLSAIALLSPAADAAQSGIKHRFIAADESRHQLHFVDQFDPSKDWTVPLKGNRDIRLLTRDRLLASVPGGYREYEVRSGKMVKEVIIREVGNKKGGRKDNCWSVVRREDGHTYIGSKASIIELDENDKEIREIKPSGGAAFRILRMTPEGHYLFSSGATTVKETDNKGVLVKEFDLSAVSPLSKKPYFALRLNNGHTVISGGLGATVIEVDRNWNPVRKFEGKGALPGMGLVYFAAVQILGNGNMVVVHWTGHGANDSRKAPQLMEFDRDGRLVWQWHDPKRAGSIHGVIVIEE